MRGLIIAITSVYGFHFQLVKFIKRQRHLNMIFICFHAQMRRHLNTVELPSEFLHCTQYHRAHCACTSALVCCGIYMYPSIIMSTEPQEQTRGNPNQRENHYMIK